HGHRIRAGRCPLGSGLLAAARGAGARGQRTPRRALCRPAGPPRPANLVPASVAPGELSNLRGRRVAVVGIEGVSEYDAESTAQAMRELGGVDAFAHAAEVADLPPGASLTDLYGRAAPALRGLRAEAVAFPPGLAGLPDRG